MVPLLVLSLSNLYHTSPDLSLSLSLSRTRTHTRACAHTHHASSTSNPTWTPMVRHSECHQAVTVNQGAAGDVTLMYDSTA
jgi:hypothetical protein